MKIRKIALRLLSDFESRGAYSNLALSSHLLDPLTPTERATLTALFYTTVERKLTLDYYIGALAGRSVEEMDPYTRNVLRLGLCQIVFMDRIPDYAAVNETVKLGRGGGERSLLNGVLRRAVKEKDSLPLPPKEKNYHRYLSVKHSIPLWIVRHAVSLLGEEEAVRFLRSVNEKPPLTVTVNTTKISRDDYLRTLVDSGIRAEATRRSPTGVRIYDSIQPKGLYGYSEGLFFVQDEASELVALALDPQAGERVIDVCACPGGKSFGAALAMGDAGEVIAMDLHESKLPLIEDGARRLGLSCVQCAAHDARAADASLIGTADRVICDVPCSGLGVLWKKPDLRYKSEESVRELPTLSLSILNESARYLKSGGTMVFSTCTTRREENEEVLAAFLEGHPEMSTVPFSDGEHEYPDGVCRTLAHRDGCDGFFIAKLKKA